jgi:hypothetical protein
MYSLTLSVHQVMDLWQVSGSVHEHDGLGHVARVATFSDTIHMGESWLEEDPGATILAVVRQWAEMTSRR